MIVDVHYHLIPAIPQEMVEGLVEALEELVGDTC